MGDKISGAMMKLRGSLTRRPGLKVGPQLDLIDFLKLTEIRLLALEGCVVLMADTVIIITKV